MWFLVDCFLLFYDVSLAFRMERCQVFWFVDCFVQTNSLLQSTRVIPSFEMVDLVGLLPVLVKSQEIEVRKMLGKMAVTKMHQKCLMSEAFLHVYGRE